ncbi:MAG: hydroxysqualene dehydroxylase HpnE [Burkholderiales bacterium]
MSPVYPYYAQPSSPSGHQIAIVGGGYAGLTAGVTLAEAGFAVTVFEASRSLGGRARRVNVDGRLIDNGQHILSGAYTALLATMKKVGVKVEDTLLRLPLHLRVAPDFSFEKAAASPPWDLVLGLFKAKGIGFLDAIRIARFIAAMKRQQFKLEHDMKLVELLTEHRQPELALKYLWEPLCVAALNTPAALASAQVFLNVIRDGVMGSNGASDMLLPRVDLSRLYPDAAAKYIGDRGGLVRTATAVRRIYWAGEGWFLDGIPTPFSSVIVASAPQHAIALLDEIEDIEATRARLAGLTYMPISTIYLQYASSFSLELPMVGLSEGPGQWAFDRGQLGGPKGMIAVVISASTGVAHMQNHELSRAITEQMHRELGAPTKIDWRQIITERRATVACRPNVYRPGNLTEASGLLLAGDYTSSDYPCTLESAVRSGIAAAMHVIHPASASIPQLR